MQQNIHFEALTACGESCTGCPKKEQGLCGGCRETDGYCQEWADTGRCPIHACAREHEALFCGLCRHFPCQRLPGLLPWKPEAETQLAALAAAYRLQNRPGPQQDA